MTEPPTPPARPDLDGDPPPPRHDSHALRTPVLASVAGIVVMLVVAAVAWNHLPERMAVHFSGGTADRYAGRLFGVLAVPVTTAAITALLVVAYVAEPYRDRLRRSAHALSGTWIATVCALLAVHVFLIANAMKPRLDPEMVGAMVIGAVLIVTGNLLPKVRRNWTFGIRTPWTLTSPLSWHRTHRVGGVAFVLAGVVVLVLGVAQVSHALSVAVILTAAVAVLLTIYSWWVWRQDPDRHQG